VETLHPLQNPVFLQLGLLRTAFLKGLYRMKTFIEMKALRHYRTEMYTCKEGAAGISMGWHQ